MLALLFLLNMIVASVVFYKVIRAGGIAPFLNKMRSNSIAIYGGASALILMVLGTVYGLFVLR